MAVISQMLTATTTIWGCTATNVSVRWRCGRGTYTWHRIDTSRSVNYGAQSDREKASYNARTGQLFIESGYDWTNDTVNLEPFANLAYTHYRNGDQ